MKTLLVLCIFFVIKPASAAQKAKIVSPEVEVYADFDFDSDIISLVREGESYQISDKTYGPFYRIKLKNGKVGYIVDYELDIEGKGRFKSKDLDDIMLEEAAKLAKDTKGTPDENDEEAELFGRPYSGLALQMINYRENTLGADQIDDLLAVGYKNISLISWSILGAFKVPKYYADKTGGTAKGLKFWADFGFSNPIVNIGRSDVRFGASLFTHISLIQLETPQRKYDLHDITVGLALEFGWLYKFKKSALDFSVKYYFDKTNYAGFGLAYLF